MEVITYSSNVTKLTTEIKVIQDNVCQGMIEIGKRLIEIKKELGHGQWLSYIEKELGYGRTTANNLIKVAEEFSNYHTCGNLPKKKIFELLSLPQEHRDEFIEKSNLDDSTVRELKAEIQKYKEENGLLTAKQKKALEDKRKVEQEKLRIQQELQREKSKQPEVVYRTDQKDIDRLRLLETVNKELSTRTSNLEKSLSMNKQLLENYKTDSEEYRKLKLQMSKLQVEMDSVAQKQVSVLKLTELASELGISVKTMNNKKNLTKLIPELQSLLEKKELSIKVALAYSSLSHEDQLEIYNSLGDKIISGMTQAETKKYIEKVKMLEGQLEDNY